MMVQTAINEIESYSAHHALFCAAVADLCANWFEWPGEEIDSLLHAALTMNVAMLDLQNILSNQAAAPSVVQRLRIDEHAALGAELLRAAGVKDVLWLDVVRRHHQPVLKGETGDPLQPAQRLAQLLQRVDIFTAKLSKRKAREGSSATVAARDACLDATGLPDPIGATMLRVLGLYPPGSYVRLTNSEFGVVIRRGEKAHTPIVASLRRADGGTFAKPRARDTSNSTFGVQRGALRAELNMVVSHEWVLAAA
jgi:hypothetical protein